MTPGQTLRAIRIARGVRSADLARTLGVNRSAVCLLETVADAGFNVRTLARWADALAMTEAEIAQVVRAAVPESEKVQATGRARPRWTS